MSISGDYDVDSLEFFKREFGKGVLQITNDDTIIKTVSVGVQFQTRQPGVLWGETLENRTSFSEQNYPVTAKAINGEEMLADLKASLRQSNACEVIKELGSLLTTIELDKYPALLALFCKMVKEIDDESLSNLIKAYRVITTLHLPDAHPEKVQAFAFFGLPPKSAEMQNVLLAVRQKMNESSSMDLFHLARAYFLDAALVSTQFIEEIFQLPSDSEKIQKIIALVKKNTFNEQKKDDVKKVMQCYLKAVNDMKAVTGEKRLSSIEMKIVYVKPSDLNQDLVYEIRYFPAK